MIRKKTFAAGMVIAGGMNDIGLEFAAMAARDGCELILTDWQPQALSQAREALSGIAGARPHVIEEAPSEAGFAARTMDNCLMYSLLGERPFALDCLVQVIDFSQTPADPWATDSAGPEQRLRAALELNEIFLQLMYERGSGAILNILVEPELEEAWLHEVYEDTRTLLLEMGESINLRDKTPGVGIYNLFLSPTSVLFQTPPARADIAPSFDPFSCSSHEIAGYGYQLLG
ncbi:MAG: hypothetical protein EAZ89_10675 [Bacteroidetes bacterium]|nr:MAG: hypothetical protein EAZ89_10675 [Bacteroidota bacterium]